MKKIKFVFLLTLLVTVSLFFFSCEKPSDYHTDSISEESNVTKSIGDHSYYGEATTVDMVNIAGIAFGEINIINDENNLYVIYSVSNNQRIGKTNLYVGNNEELVNNPSLDNFPYKTLHSSYPFVTEFTYTIPLQNLPDCFTVAAHAEVVHYNEVGLEFVESVWGAGEYIGEGSEGTKLEYCKQSSEIEIPIPVGYQTESAWVSGTRYNKKGNWATYSIYNGTTTSMPIYAGQTINAGTATFTQNPNSTVTISIELANGWELKPVKESVKIQGYNTAPSGNPAPGKFNTYKGTETTVTVPQYMFYGIHLDVRKPIY